jgi:hypothetical protein
METKTCTTSARAIARPMKFDGVSSVGRCEAGVTDARAAAEGPLRRARG